MSMRGECFFIFSRGKLQSCFVFLFHLQWIILSSLCPFSFKRHFLLEVESISCFLSWALCGVILEERSSKCNLAAISVELVPCVVPPKICKKKKSSNRGEIWFALLNWKETFTNSLVFFFFLYKFLSKTYWDTYDSKFPIWWTFDRLWLRILKQFYFITVTKWWVNLLNRICLLCAWSLNRDDTEHREVRNHWWILTAPFELTQLMLMRDVNLIDGGLSGYSAEHSIRRLYILFSKAVWKSRQKFMRNVVSKIDYID